MTEEDMTTSGSAQDTGKMLECKEFKNGTLSSMSISTPNSNSMVTMAAADLIALCKRRSEYTGSQISEESADLIEHKMAFFLNAEVISDADILNKNQQKPSEDLSTLEQ
ncbi:conserved hypothetical protein [Histoplasma capsulatum G186AR]|uniref:Uncharacterized protein n=1 Tax=Ajellomyces capsulatus (strain G186AR / H82 / ATCC MYA-2454 / RMSCC 2432) TaxID=447093 RepID=C0NMG5_AJECG|nr:uncharacterized protein HCBG_04695 [Histoplasma capsulatum G186AR]EEH07816.1 conserved hypothetical protein [Histoplasma capsulatum G186AR]